MKNLFILFVLTISLAIATGFVDLKNLPIDQLLEAYPGLSQNESVQEVDNSFQGTALEVVDLTNNERQNNGLAPLKVNEKLMNSSLAKAQDMKAKGYFDHVSPEGLQPWFFVEKAGYRYRTASENLAEGYFSAQELVQAWMNSEGHRKNILSTEYTEIGVAILEFDDNGAKNYLAVQHFGSSLTDIDLGTVVVCDKKSKKYCEDVAEKVEEIEDAIDDQKKIIKEAEKSGASKENLSGAEANLEKLKEMEDEFEAEQKKCQDFVKKCQEWK